MGFAAAGTLYTAQLQAPRRAPPDERQEAWRTRGVRITLAGQSVQLPDVLTCLDRAFAVFFCRVQMGERGKELGYPGC